MRLVFGLLVLLTAVACSASPERGELPSSQVVDTRQLASVEVVGGLCPAGACRESIIVKRDGSWLREQTGHDDRTGVLGGDSLDDLIEAISRSSIRAKSALSTCAALNSDGRVIVYSVNTKEGIRETSTCEIGFLENDPAVVALEKLRETLPRHGDG